MPFLRFSRDERGYENTYVLHTFRSRGGARPRILYWFRTAPNVKVGRLPLDEKAIRAVEESNPDLSFDWSKMLKVRPAAKPREIPGGKRVPKRRRRAAEGGEPERTAVPAAVPAVEPESDIGEALPAEMIPEGIAALSEAEGGQPGEQAEPEWQHPVVALMGDDTLARLRARYAEIQARITEKRSDPETRDGLRARAEALNPDGWSTVEEAVRGIETFEADAEALKGVLGRRRPRSRRGSRRGGEATDTVVVPQGQDHESDSPGHSAPADATKNRDSLL